MTVLSRQARKAQTRALIVQVATRHFEAHGFAGAKIRDIAREAGVAAGTVFVHFESKTDLLHTAFYGDLQRIVDAACRSLPPARLDTQLRHLAEGFYRAFAQRPELYLTLLQQSLLATGVWGERFRAQVHDLGIVVGGLFEAAKSRGELLPATDSRTATLAFFSFYYFLLIDAAKAGFEGIDDRLELFDALLAQHLEGHRP